MKKLIFGLSCILFLSSILQAQTNLIQYEYWFNSDYVNSHVVPIAPTPYHQLSLAVDASSLPEGVNVLNIRYKDENGHYSSILSNLFYKDACSLTSSKLIQYEYWFNNDYINKYEEDIFPTSQHLMDTYIDASTLPDGVNILNIRYQDQNGLYSSILSKLFLKIPEAQISNNLKKYEYWFNDDYSNKQVVEVSPSQENQLYADLNASMLPDGVNVFNIRYQQENGVFSSTLSQLFYKREQFPFENSELVAYKTWFDNDHDNVVYVQLQEPIEQFHFFEQIDMTHIPMGEHTVNFQFLDINGQWSVITTDSIFKVAKPEAAFSISSTGFCEGSTISFVNESIDADSWYWDFGDGNYSEEFEPEYVYSVAGSYEVSLTVTNSESGSQSSIMTYNLVINPIYSDVQEVSICEGESYEFAGYTYTEPGEYEHAFTTIHGCDSLVTLLLTVKVSDLNTLPLIDPIADVILQEDDLPETIYMSGIEDGLECENHPLGLSVLDFDNTLISQCVIEYVPGEASGSLTLSLVENAFGQSEITLGLINEVTGKQTNVSFSFEVLPVNDPPVAIAEIDDIERTENDTFMAVISSEKGVLFDDPDPDDSFQIAITMSEGGILPDWLDYRNDSLMVIANPAIGCLDLLASATDTAGEEASIEFLLCISSSTGLNFLNDDGVSVFPNPTSGKVYINTSDIISNEVDVSVFDKKGQRVLNSRETISEYIIIDLSKQTPGLYLIVLEYDGIRNTYKLIVRP